MAKRSPAANLGRRARRRIAKPAPEQAGGAVDTQPELSPEQINSILGQQVGVCRQAFFRLASVRAADLVKFEGKSWDDGANYINAEMQGLDQQLASVVPPQGQG